MLIQFWKEFLCSYCPTEIFCEMLTHFPWGEFLLAQHRRVTVQYSERYGKLLFRQMKVENFNRNLRGRDHSFFQSEIWGKSTKTEWMQEHQTPDYAACTALPVLSTLPPRDGSHPVGNRLAVEAFPWPTWISKPASTPSTKFSFFCLPRRRTNNGRWGGLAGTSPALSVLLFPFVHVDSPNACLKKIISCYYWGCKPESVRHGRSL